MQSDSNTGQEVGEEPYNHDTSGKGFASDPHAVDGGVKRMNSNRQNEERTGYVTRME